MLKTNARKTRENIMAWIRGDIAYLQERHDYHTEDEHKTPYDLENDNGLCAFIYHLFKEEKGWEIDHYGTRTAFFNWAQGLALGQMFAYYYEPAVDILGNILEETEEEKARYTESEAEELLTKLIYREVTERAARYL